MPSATCPTRGSVVFHLDKSFVLVRYLLHRRLSLHRSFHLHGGFPLWFRFRLDRWHVSTFAFPPGRILLAFVPLVSTFELVQQTRNASKARDSALDFAWTLCITADNLDSVGVDLVRIVELEVDVLDYKRPHIVAEPVGIEVALREPGSVCSCLNASFELRQSRHEPTLNVSLALTLSASTSATALSKFARIFIASWGSMRRSVIRLSSVSVRAPPRLSAVSQRALRDVPRCVCSTCFDGRARST